METRHKATKIYVQIEAPETISEAVAGEAGFPAGVTGVRAPE
jgi:hypothetical protein